MSKMVRIYFFNVSLMCMSIALLLLQTVCEHLVRYLIKIGLIDRLIFSILPLSRDTPVVIWIRLILSSLQKFSNVTNVNRDPLSVMMRPGFPYILWNINFRYFTENFVNSLRPKSRTVSNKINMEISKDHSIPIDLT